MQQEHSGHQAFKVINPAGRPDLVITCDHASNVIPAEFSHLGLAPKDRTRHIAWDIGAEAVAERLAATFDAPAVICGTSRLIIDCNRSPADAAAIPEKSDGVKIIGNIGLTAAQRLDRVKRFFDPYHSKVEQVILERIRAGHRPIILSVHSMTPEMNGRFRPWEISISSNEDRRVAEMMLALLRRRTDITVGDNEPYGLDMAEDYSTPVHALARGLDYVQVEFRQDRIETDEGAHKWADIFAQHFGELIKQLSA